MAKNLLFTLLLSGIFNVFPPLLATNISELLEQKTFKADNCDAPAPDSFRVSTSGYNFVTLAWKPAWPGAIHTLVVLTKIENTGAWMPVDTIFNVSGVSYIYSSIQYDPVKCGFMISTNCIDGEPGDEVAFGGPPVALILELIIAGRRPNNPSEVDPCKPLNVSEHNWIGFSVSNVDGFNIVANTFEVIIKNDHPVVKRVSAQGKRMNV